MNEGKCSSCGAAILFVKLKSGKWNPLDPTPCADGNVRILEDGTAEVMTDLEKTGHVGDKYKSHFASCKNAKQHRRKK